MTTGMKAFEKMQLHYRERDLSARKWKEAGGKVIGYTYTSVPEEIIIAAGFLPMMITGNPEISTEAGDRYMEDYFCPFVRSVHNLFVIGRYSFLDLAVFPHTNDSIKRCYYYLWTEKRNEPDLPIPPLTIFDSLHTRKFIANRYVRGRMEAFKEKMEELSGKKITPEALSRAIELCNENRRLLKQVADLRRAYPPRVSGVEALQIIGSSFFMPKEEHNKLLKDFLADADKLPPKDGVRLFLSGTIVDNLQLYELIESCGAVIVSEDICTGNRYSDNPVDTSMEPLDALTDRYHTKSHEGRMHPLSELVNYVVQCARDSGAQGAIFNYLQWDDSHGWNFPSQRDALAEIGIPSMAFEMQEYKIRNQEQLRTRTEAFVEMIKEDSHHGTR
jgi:bcr-type benzoyl-CoA reductase subunit C